MPVDHQCTSVQQEQWAHVEEQDGEKQIVKTGISKAPRESSVTTSVGLVCSVPRWWTWKKTFPFNGLDHFGNHTRNPLEGAQVMLRTCWKPLIMSIAIFFPGLPLVQFVPILKIWETKTFSRVVNMEALRVKMLCQQATKETHSGLNTVELAVYLAVSHFNDNAGSIILVL